MTPDFDVTIVGGGVIGLAVGRALALGGHAVLVLEAEDRAGLHASTRNSGVIHAGLYYPPGSLKARWCVRGRELLYGYLARSGVPHERCGKLIVAAGDDEVARLDALEIRARTNGVTGLRRLDAAEMRALEPSLHGSQGLLSESTGIVDTPSLLSALQADLEGAAGALVVRTPFERAHCVEECWRVHTAGADPHAFTSRWLINAAGLFSGAVAGRVEGLPDDATPSIHRAVGHYYRWSGSPPFSRLVYPLPEAGGLGVHFTPEVAGAGRFGPDVRWQKGSSGPVDYTFDDSERERFIRSIRRYYPEVDARRLHPDSTGVRPKLVQQGAPDADFRVLAPADHGVAGYVGLHGFESPGLTAALAVAEWLEDVVAR